MLTSRLAEVARVVTADCALWQRQIPLDPHVLFPPSSELRGRFASLVTLVLALDSHPDVSARPARIAALRLVRRLATTWERDPAGGQLLAECGALEIVSAVAEGAAPIRGGRAAWGELSLCFDAAATLASSAYAGIKGLIAQSTGLLAAASSVILAAFDPDDAPADPRAAPPATPPAEPVAAGIGSAVSPCDALSSGGVPGAVIGADSTAVEDGAAAAAAEAVAVAAVLEGGRGAAWTQACRFVGNVCFGTDAHGAVACKQRLLSLSPSPLSRIMRTLSSLAHPGAPAGTLGRPLVRRAVRWACHAASSVAYGHAPNEAQRILLRACAAPRVLLDVAARLCAAAPPTAGPHDVAGGEEEEEEEEGEEGGAVAARRVCLFHAVEALANAVFRFPDGQRALHDAAAGGGAHAVVAWAVAAGELHPPLLDVVCFLVFAAAADWTPAGVAASVAAMCRGSAAVELRLRAAVAPPLSTTAAVGGSQVKLPARRPAVQSPPAYAAWRRKAAAAFAAAAG